MAVPLPDARELSDDVLDALRLRALRGCALGFTEDAGADLLGVCRETVGHYHGPRGCCRCGGTAYSIQGWPVGVGSLVIIRKPIPRHCVCTS